MSETGIVIKETEAMVGIKREILALLEYAKTIVITNQDENGKAGDTAKLLGSLATKLDNTRKEQTNPVNKLIEDYKAKVDVAVNMAREVKGLIERKQTAYMQEVKKIEQERLAKIAKEEAERKALEEAERQKHIVKVIESTGVTELSEQATELKKETHQEIVETITQTHFVKVSTKGDVATSGLEYKYSGTVEDTEKALEFILKTRRFELIKEFSPASINQLSKAMFNGKTSNVIRENGFIFTREEKVKNH
jgi:hypothetical protein